jgi:hypothetical protein
MFEGDTSVRFHFTLDVVVKLAVRAGGQSAHNRIDARRASWLDKAGLKLDEVTGLELVRHVERAPSSVSPGRLPGRPPACTAAGWRTARALAERREEARPALRRYYAALSQ